MAEVVDLRGRELAVSPPPVLADPSGRRARLLARTGRVVGLLFSLWLAGLILAGLGVLPTGAVPLSQQLSSPAPPAIRHAPKPTPAEPSAKLQSASAPLVAGQAGATKHPSTAASRSSRGTPGSSSTRGAAGGALSRGSGTHHPATTQGTLNHSSPAGSSNHSGATNSPGAGSTGVGTGKSTAPGQVQKTSTPTQSQTTSPGKSGSAPGHQKTTTTVTTTTPGNSAYAPGHTGTHGSGGGH